MDTIGRGCDRGCAVCVCVEEGKGVAGYAEPVPDHRLLVGRSGFILYLIQCIITSIHGIMSGVRDSLQLNVPNYGSPVHFGCGNMSSDVLATKMADGSCCDHGLDIVWGCCPPKKAV